MNELNERIAQMPQKDKDRFWSNVEKRGPDECWPWKGRLSLNGGHGQFTVVMVGADGPFKFGPKAHRVAHILSSGTFERGPIVRHVVCRNGACCNPAHLMDGTHKDNADDREQDGMTARGDKNGSRARPEMLKRGQDNPRFGWTTLTEKSVREIRRLCAEGQSQRIVAAMFGVKQQAISKVVRRLRWKFVT